MIYNYNNLSESYGDLTTTAGYIDESVTETEGCTVAVRIKDTEDLS